MSFKKLKKKEKGFLLMKLKRILKSGYKFTANTFDFDDAEAVIKSFKVFYYKKGFFTLCILSAEPYNKDCKSFIGMAKRNLPDHEDELIGKKVATKKAIEDYFEFLIKKGYIKRR